MPAATKDSRERHRLHNDIGRILCRLRGVRPFLRKGALKPPLQNPSMETNLIGLISLGLLLYLVVAVLRPEKF